MEDVLEVYQRPFDEARPVVCVDETSKQLVSHKRTPIAARPGKPRRVDDEYVRHGTANIFLAVEPLTGNVATQVTERRTSKDFAVFLKYLADDKYPDATTIVLVMDNLNIHQLACFYDKYPPQEARRLALRFEVHHTPKHGSWMNIAEIQFSVLSRQCLRERVETAEELHEKITEWQKRRRPSPVNWRFTTDDARIKLSRLYPSLS